MQVFAVFIEKISAHTDVVALILRPRLTVQIQKLNYKLKSSKQKPLGYKSTL